MYRSIVFFNHFHNGDIHLSRTFVDKIGKYFLDNKICSGVLYYHRNNPELLKDINHIVYTNNISKLCSEKWLMHKVGPDLYLNTWYASGSHKFMNTHKISFDCLYSLFEYYFKNITGKDLSILGSPESFFPKINYDKFYITKINEWAKKEHRRKILVSNGAALSGQVANIQITPAIKRLSKKYPDKVFILTNQEKDNNLNGYSNITYSKNIIGKNGFDLNENAYLGGKCALNVGRASGVHTFCINQDILFNTDSYYLSFSNLGYEDGNFWLTTRFKNKIKYRAKTFTKDLLTENQFEEEVDNILSQL